MLLENWSPESKKDRDKKGEKGEKHPPVCHEIETQQLRF